MQSDTKRWIYLITERGFQCEECDETFATIKEFRKHRRTHNSDQFYKCKDCPRTFLHFTSYRGKVLAKIGADFLALVE